MRGKAHLHHWIKERTRITPACAGKSGSSKYISAKTEDHPRVCGEKGWVQIARSRRMGSPPRVRGKAEDTGSIMLGVGITPACAGKST